MADEIGQIVARLTLDLKAWEKSMKKAKSDVKTFGGIIGKNAQKIKSFGKSMTIAGAAITGAFAAMFGSANKFNKEMARVATLMPGSRDQIVKMKDEVRDLAVETGKSTGDIAGGLFQVISAQFKAADAMDVLGTASKAATAGMSTTKEAMDLISAASKGYNTQTREGAKRTADLAFLTNKLGLTTFPELAASMGKVIPTAAKMNVTQEELFATYATLTGVTGNAAEITTQLGGVLRGMIKPTGDMKKAISEAGFANGESMIKALGFQKALQTLLKQTDGTSVGFGKLFRRAEGLTGLFALMGPQAKQFTSNLKAMKSPTGSMNEAFLEMTEGVNKAGFQFDQAKVKLSIMIQRLGESAIPIISKFVGWITKVIDKITNWVKENPILAESIAKIALALGAFMTVAGPLLVMLPGIAKGFDLMSKSMQRGSIILAAGAAAIMAVKLGTEALIQAQDRAIKKIKDSVNQNVGNLRKFRAFQKVATEEELKWMNQRFVAMNKITDNAGQSAGMILGFLKMRLKGNRKLALESAIAEKEITKTTKSESEKRVKTTTESQKLIFANTIETSKKQKAAAKELSNFRQEIFDQEIQKRIEAEQFFDETLAELNQEREMLRLEGTQKELALLQAETEAKRKAILQNVSDRQQALALIEQLEENSAIKRDEIIQSSLENNKNKWIETWDKMTSFASQAIGMLSSIFRQASQNRLDALDKEYEERKQKILDNVSDETEREKQLEALEDEFSAKKKDAARSSAKADKAAAIMGAIVNTAQAVTKAYAQGGIFGIVTGSIMAALGAIQVGLIKSQPIPFAEGGIVTEPTQALIGEAGPEAVIPLNQLQQVSDEIGGGQGVSITFDINTMDSKGLLETVQQKVIPILKKATRDEVFLIHPNAVRSF